MAVGIGLDAIHVSSHVSSTTPSSRNRIFSSSSASTSSPLASWHLNHPLLTPSVLQLSRSRSRDGCRNSVGKSSSSPSWSRRGAWRGNGSGRERRPAVLNKCVQQVFGGWKSVFVSEMLVCSSCSAERGAAAAGSSSFPQALGDSDFLGSKIHVRRRDVEILCAAAAVKTKNVRGSGGRRRRVSSSTTRCEAAGGGDGGGAAGGVSYNERIEASDTIGGDEDGNGKLGGGSGESLNGSSGQEGEQKQNEEKEKEEEEGDENSALYVLKELLRVAQDDLEKHKRNREILEEKAQSVAERAIALKDEVIELESAASAAIARLEELVLQENNVTEEVQKAAAGKDVAQDLLRAADSALETALAKSKANAQDFKEKNEKEEKEKENVKAAQDEQKEKKEGGEGEDENEDEKRKEEERKNKMVEATLEVTTERTVDISVRPVEEPSAKPEVVQEKGGTTTLAKTEVTVTGSNEASAVALASSIIEETEAVESAKALLKESETQLEKIEARLVKIQQERLMLEQEVMRMSEAAEGVRVMAETADEDATAAMEVAEKTTAEQLEAAQRVGDAEFALQKAQSYAADAAQQAMSFAAVEAEKLAQELGKTVEEIEEELESRSEEEEAAAAAAAEVSHVDEEKGKEEDGAAAGGKVEEVAEKGEDVKKDFVPPPAPPPSVEVGSPVADKAAASAVQPESKKVSEPEVKRPPKEKEPEPVKEKEQEPVKPPLPKAAKKRSSKFFPASYFSSEDGEEFSPSKAYSHFASSMKGQLAKVVIGVALLFAGGAYMNHRMERRAMPPSPPAYTTTLDQATEEATPVVAGLKKLTRRVADIVNKIPAQEVSGEEASLFDVLWLLLASVIFVPLFTKIPGGSPVLGYLVAGVLIGPHTVHIIQNVHGTKAIAEFGVVFLLFNIGLELSVDRLSSMKKYVFGLGTAQVMATAAGVGVVLTYVAKITGPPAIIIASALALSSTAVVLQVLQERGESTSRHGRAAFSVLLFQDLAVVVLLIMIPLLSSKGGVGLKEIGSALGIAGVKALVAITGIIASGRLFLRPIYKQMADNHNPEIFAANTLLVVLGTSVLTARAGLSMALGAFLAGLLLSETEFALQVESDIAPYRGLLLGLFFMTVGMSIDPKLFTAKFPEIVTALAFLIAGKTLVVACVGCLFGLSVVAAVRTGLLLAPGGEFAFVAFGEAVNQGIMSTQLSSLLYLVVGLSMALTPWLAAGGQLIAAKFEQQDVRSLLPRENETDDLQGHIIICGFGRVGQIIAQLLAERLIPFVALDVRSDRVSAGRQLDLPVYFGDAGSKEVLHKIGADRAAAAVITLDTPGANYRTVWALCKHFPGVKTFVRAHDVDHGLNLEKAGATAVVPETLEPSLQLAAAVLQSAKVPAHEISSAIDDFRGRHLSELAELSGKSGTSLGYGFSKLISKTPEGTKLKPEDEAVVEKWPDGTIIAVP